MRDDGQADIGEVMVRDQSEGERGRHALAVRLAVGCEREHRLDPRLELQCGAHLAQEAHDLVGAVREAVRRAGLDHDRLAGAELDRLAALLDAQGAGDDGEAFALVWVHMGGGDERVGLENRLEASELAVRVGGRPVEDERVAREGVDDRVSCANHGEPSCRVVSSGSFGLRAGVFVGAEADLVVRKPIFAQGCQPPG